MTLMRDLTFLQASRLDCALAQGSQYKIEGLSFLWLAIQLWCTIKLFQERFFNLFCEEYTGSIEDAEGAALNFIKIMTKIEASAVKL